MQAEVSHERKYALTKIKPGDWLLPSNDARTLWRLAKYEDGPSHGLMDWPRDRELWGIWRWTGHIDGLTADGVEDWNRWEMWDGSYESRTQAMNAALKGGA